MHPSGAVTLKAAAGVVMVSVAAMLLEPYSGPTSGYERPVRYFFATALAGDSAALAKLALSSEPVSTALGNASAQPELVRLWAQAAAPGNGYRTGDTTWVWFGASRDCAPDTRHARDQLLVGFVGPADAPLVSRLIGGCLR